MSTDYILVFDMETDDPHIAEKRGAGWCFKNFRILGMAYKIDDQATKFTTSIDEMKSLVERARTLVCHNAQYDIGCLHRLGIQYTDKTIIDTAILAKLYDNSLMSYSLDSLSSNFLGARKDLAALREAVESMDEKFKPKDVMANMRMMFQHRPDLVAQYAIQDVELTYRLSKRFKSLLYEEAFTLLPLYSDLIKALVLWRSRGVRMDFNQIAESTAKLRDLETEERKKFEEFCGNINIESTKQLAEAFTNLGLTVGVSDKGGPSVDSDWRATQTHPAVLALDRAKRFQKLRREFIEKIEQRSEDGRIYPEINIMGAAETGRFSSSNPNIQQIPKRSEEGKLIRKIFLPEEGERWYSLDFASQEPRLQVAYASLVGCDGADSLLQSFIDNPKHDLHEGVAQLAGIDRKEAKTINLGISYGMGIGKLAASLKLEEPAARALLSKYKKLTPYLAQLNKAVQEAGLKRGYVSTLLGRRLAMDYAKPYKALNKLIQGSAADMTTLCLVTAYREGIPVMFSVHDSIELSLSDAKQAVRMKEIMEQSFPSLIIPFYTDIVDGETWGDV